MLVFPIFLTLSLPYFTNFLLLNIQFLVEQNHLQMSLLFDKPDGIDFGSTLTYDLCEFHKGNNVIQPVLVQKIFNFSFDTHCSKKIIPFYSLMSISSTQNPQFIFVIIKSQNFLQSLQLILQKY
ncbi:hypothetical protein pb186bvf_015124 [Paramecium bursaria]